MNDAHFSSSANIFNFSSRSDFLTLDDTLLS